MEEADTTRRLPAQVFQQLTDLDKKRLEDHLLQENHLWTNYGRNVRRVEELEDMRHSKVELEALNWLGMDYCGQWLLSILEYHDELIQNENTQEEVKEWMEII